MNEDVWLSIAIEVILGCVTVFCVREMWIALRSGEFRKSLLNPYGPWSTKTEPIRFAFYATFAGVFTAIAFAMLAINTSRLVADYATKLVLVQSNG